MGNFLVTSDHIADVTILPNIFIDKYMKECNEAQLKMYLYLLRNCYAGIPTGVCDLADHFNHTEKDVMRILHYLENCGLLALGFDASGCLSAITMTRPEALASVRSEEISMQNATVTPVFSFVTSGSELMAESAAQTKTIRESAGKVQITKASESPLKASETSGTKEEIPMAQDETHSEPAKATAPSMDELRAFRSSEDCEQLLFLSESYLARPLTGNDIGILFSIYNEYKFDVELMDCLLQHCAGSGITDFPGIKLIAQSWFKNGISTPSKAREFIKAADEISHIVMAAFGRRKAPTPAERDMMCTWSHEYGFSGEIILEACNRAALATDSNRFRYADAILRSWHKDGLNTLDAIMLKEETYRSSRSCRTGAQGAQSGRSTQTPKARSASETAFGTFMQTDYDFDAIEQALLNL